MRWYERFDWVLARLLPERCAACQTDVEPPGALLCGRCASEAQLGPRWRRVGGVPCWAPAHYEGPVAEVLKRFKYGGHPELARRLARSVVEHAGCLEPLRESVLVPVPLHPFRLVERGYNQSALLAKYIARHTGAAVTFRGLSRRIHTAKQSRLDRAERLRNLGEAFAARDCLTGVRVMLVDDVVTTGATAASCVQALCRAGAIVDGVVCVAQRGDD